MEINLSNTRNHNPTCFWQIEINSKTCKAL